MFPAKYVLGVKLQAANPGIIQYVTDFLYHTAVKWPESD